MIIIETRVDAVKEKVGIPAARLSPLLSGSPGRGPACRAHARRAGGSEGGPATRVMGVEGSHAEVEAFG